MGTAPESCSDLGAAGNKATWRALPMTGRALSPAESNTSFGGVACAATRIVSISTLADPLKTRSHKVRLAAPAEGMRTVVHLLMSCLSAHAEAYAGRAMPSCATSAPPGIVPTSSPMRYRGRGAGQLARAMCTVVWHSASVKLQMVKPAWLLKGRHAPLDGSQLPQWTKTVAPRPPRSLLPCRHSAPVNLCVYMCVPKGSPPTFPTALKDARNVPA
mmetsp:Transcript_20032/g.40762  ORF Transcript_20032/g.40762 Transcript_20032/m.40762 type:complete len:216 (-) Transcript_20032:517-1164(-)